MLFNADINKLISNIFKAFGLVETVETNTKAILFLYYGFVFSKTNSTFTVWNPQFNVEEDGIKGVLLKAQYFRVH